MLSHPQQPATRNTCSPFASRQYDKERVDRQAEFEQDEVKEKIGA